MSKFTSDHNHRTHERHGRAKLDWETVAEIRERYEREDISYTRLGEEYGVGSTAIGNVITEKTWPPEEAP